MIGHKLADRYNVTEVLGQGGMGVVYRAFDQLLERDVALKLISPQTLSPDAIERLLREARMIAKMEHSGIIPLFDVGQHEESLFLVMPVVAGSNLRKLLDSGVMLHAEIVDIGIQVANVLEYSHAQGIVHRDIKPENIMVSRLPTGRLSVKVMDFGIAVQVAEHRITREGLLVGTPAYLSPEQFLGGEIDFRTDIYTLGVLLYECFAGKPPFMGEFARVMYCIAEEIPRSITEVAPGIDSVIAELVMGCLAKDPMARPESARFIAERLVQVRDSMSAREHLATMASEPPKLVQNRGMSGQSRGIVGRSGELSELAARLSAATRNECQLVLLAGEAGIGKTALVTEFVQRTQAAGVLVLYGRYSEPEDRLDPFQGFNEILLEYFQSERAKSDFADGLDLTDLRRPLVSLFPDLGDMDMLGDTLVQPKYTTSISENASNRLDIFDVIARTLSRLGGGKPRVIVLEDLHSADISIGALQYIFRRLSSTKTLLIGTYRPSELHPGHPLAQMLLSLRDGGSVLWRQLMPLSTEEHLALIKSIMPSGEPDENLIKYLVEATGGNPLFTIELIRSLLELRLIVRDDMGRWSATSELDPAHTTVPVTIQQVIQRRLETLANEHRELLLVASIPGRNFSFKELEMLYEGEGDCEEICDKLIQLGYLCADERGHHRISFTSGMMREVIYKTLSNKTRRHLHQRYAEQMEKHYASRLERVGHQLFYHFARAGVADKAVHHALVAARNALDVRSPWDAIRCLRTALDFISDPEWEGDGSQEGKAWTLLATAHAMAGRVEDALIAAHKAVSVFERLKAEKDMLVPLVLAAETAWADHRLDEARKFTERAISVATAQADIDSLCRLVELGELVAGARGDQTGANYYKKERERLLGGTESEKRQDEAIKSSHQQPVSVESTASEKAPDSLFAERLGDLLLLRGDYLAAQEAFESARQERQRTSGGLSVQDEARFLQRLALLAANLGRYDEAIERCQKGIDVLGSASTLLTISLQAVAALTCSWAGRFEQARDWVNKGLLAAANHEVKSDPEWPKIEALLYRALGNVHVALGMHAEAMDAYKKGLVACERAQDRWEYSIALFNLGDAAALSGDYTSASYYLDEASKEKSAIGDRWGLSYVHELRARLHLDQGNAHRAMEDAAAGLQLALEIGNPKLVAMLRLSMAASHLAVDNIASAEKEFHLALKESAAAQATSELTLAYIGISAVSKELGRFVGAKEALDKAEALAQKAGSRPLILASAMHYGHLAAAMGEYNDAETYYQTALDLCTALGNRYRRFDVLLAMARMNIQRGQYQEAVPQLRAIYEDAHRAGDVRHRALSSLGLAEAHFLRGDAEQALASAESALQDFESIHAKKHVGATYELLARLFVQTTQFRRAETYAQSAIEQIEGLGDAAKRELGRAYLSLGHVYRESGDSKKMTEAFQKALECIEHSGDRAALADCYCALAVPSTRTEPEYAVDLLQRATQLCEEIGHFLGKAQCLGMLGEVLRRMSRFQDALVVFEDEERLLRKTGYHRGLAINAFHFASIYYLQGDYPKAFTAVDSNIESSRRVGNIGFMFGLELRGLMHAEAGRWDEAWTDLELALERAQRLQHAERLINIRRSRAEHFLYRGELDKALSEVSAGQTAAHPLIQNTVVDYGYLARERLDVIYARVLLATGDALGALEKIALPYATFRELRIPHEEISAHLVLMEACMQANRPPSDEEVTGLLKQIEDLGLLVHRAQAIGLLGRLRGDGTLIEQSKQLGRSLGCSYRVGNNQVQVPTRR